MKPSAVLFAAYRTALSIATSEATIGVAADVPASAHESAMQTSDAKCARSG